MDKQQFIKNIINIITGDSWPSIILFVGCIILIIVYVILTNAELLPLNPNKLPESLIRVIEVGGSILVIVMTLYVGVVLGTKLQSNQRSGGYESGLYHNHPFYVTGSSEYNDVNKVVSDNYLPTL